MSEENEVVCTLKHTAFQPPDKEWFCPKCGVDSSGKLKNGKYPGDNVSFSGAFCIEESPNFDCSKIHPEDLIVCSHCESEWSGQSYSNMMMKKANLAVCPCCKGAGTVDKKKAEAFKKGKKK